MDAVDRKVASIVYGMVVEAYGLPGHMRPESAADLCPGCEGDGCGACGGTGFES